MNLFVLERAKPKLRSVCKFHEYLIKGEARIRMFCVDFSQKIDNGPVQSNLKLNGSLSQNC